MPFRFLFADLWTLQQKIEDLKGHSSFFVLTYDEVNRDWLVHTTPYLAIVSKSFLEAFHLHQPNPL